MLLNQIVKKKAAAVGIDICRITDGSVLKKERAILEKRAQGKYWPQPFTNQDLDQLTKPSLHFENLESIIVAAVSYNNQSESRQLSNYITKVDYHDYLRTKLEQLLKNLKAEFEQDFNYKIFVDTAPFLERALARRAGVGFIGKNTALINPEYGSYLFLGEIFTDLKLKKDEPLNLDCGRCRICLKNCEGGALKEEYLLAAGDCISYLTQKKGLLKKSEIDKIGSHIWGCDACQSCCPYNQKIPAAGEKELQFFAKDLEYFLKIDRINPPAELKATAASWRGSRVLIRNALLAAAADKKTDYFDLIREKLKDNSPVIRYYAAYALLKIDFKKGAAAVKELITQENNKKYKNKIKELLVEEEADYGD